MIDRVRNKSVPASDREPDTSLFPPEIAASLEVIKILADRLNAERERRAEMIRNASDYLTNYCQIGISARVPIHNFSDDDKKFFLAYGRIGSDFQIHIVTQTQQDGEMVESSMRVENCPRHVRMESANKLATLMEVLASEVESELSRLSP